MLETARARRVRRLTGTVRGGVGLIPRALRALQPSREARVTAEAHGVRADTRGESAVAQRVQELDARSARPDAGGLLTEIERLRPGLVRHRCLALGPAPEAVTRELRTGFDQFEALSARPEHLLVATSAARYAERRHDDGRWELPFADETFDLVHCALPAGAGRGVSEPEVGEVLRVLRLYGVAVIDAAGEPDQAPVQDGGPGGLGVVVSGVDGLSLIAGTRCEVAATVTNTSTRTLGSAINPLRVESSWNGANGAERVLDGILIPGDSLTTTLPVAVPSATGMHLLELSVVSRTTWEERRSARTSVMVDIERPGRGGSQGAVASLQFGPHEPLALAVARASGMILAVRSRGAQPGRRYIFARA